MKKRRANSDLSGRRILILSGDFEGQEGICLGTGAKPGTWAIAPEASTVVLNLKFEKEFALLIDLSGRGENN